MQTVGSKAASRVGSMAENWDDLTAELLVVPRVEHLDDCWAARMVAHLVVYWAGQTVEPSVEQWVE